MLRNLFSLFPACAGVILKDAGERQAAIAFPRMRGGDPFTDLGADVDNAFSPHARG